MCTPIDSVFSHCLYQVRLWTMQLDFVLDELYWTSRGRLIERHSRCPVMSRVHYIIYIPRSFYRDGLGLLCSVNLFRLVRRFGLDSVRDQI